MGSAKAPKQPDFTRWALNDLIEVCVDVKLVPIGTGMVSSATRQYRNLVHPGVEFREKVVFAKEEASIALNVLDMLHRELSR